MFVMMASLPSSLDVFVVLCRLGGGKRRSSKACSSQILKFAQVRVASGFAFLGVRRVAIKWLLVEQELCITSIQLETKWNWEFADTTRENLRVEWIQVIMTISRSNGLDLNGQRYWADSLVPGNCQDVKTSGMSQDGMCPQKIVILPWFPMIFRWGGGTNLEAHWHVLTTLPKSNSSPPEKFTSPQQERIKPSNHHFSGVSTRC